MIRAILGYLGGVIVAATLLLVVVGAAYEHRTGKPFLDYFDGPAR